MLDKQDLKDISDLMDKRFFDFDKKMDDKFENFAQIVQGGFAEVDKRLDSIESDLKEVKTNIVEIKVELIDIKLRLDSLEQRISALEDKFGDLSLSFDKLSQAETEDLHAM